MIKFFPLVVKTLLVFTVFVYSLFAIKSFVTKDLWIHYKECGTVVGSSSEDVPIKHGTQTELYLLMQYEHDGFQAQEVGATTYFQYKDKIGTKLCFSLTKRNPELDTFRKELHHMMGGLFIVVYFLIFLYIFIGWCEGD